MVSCLVIMFHYIITMLFCVLLYWFVILRFNFVRYNEIFCLIMLFCTVTILFVCHNIVLCLVMLYCNVTMFFCMLQWYCVLLYSSYYMLLYFFSCFVIFYIMILSIILFFRVISCVVLLVRFRGCSSPFFPVTRFRSARWERLGKCSFSIWSVKELLYWQFAAIYKLLLEKLRKFPKVDINLLMRLLSSRNIL